MYRGEELSMREISEKLGCISENGRKPHTPGYAGMSSWSATSALGEMMMDLRFGRHFGFLGESSSIRGTPRGDVAPFGYHEAPEAVE